jgi:hypothetical protein
MDYKTIRILVYRQEGIEVTQPTLVQATVPKSVKGNGLMQRIRTAVTIWAQAGSEDAQRVFGYAGEDFNLGDLSGCIYNPDHVGAGDDGSLVRALEQQGVKDLIIDSLDVCDWSYDTPLVEALETDE